MPLVDINADIKRGEVISVIGPSGSGKSTMLRCINRLEEPTSGSIFINGIRIKDREEDILRMRLKVGMVFQSFNLFAHLMIIENVMLAQTELLKKSRKEAFDESLRCLKLVGLGDKIYNYPDELSGGQKQRAAIARTMAMHPDIMLLDEPTSALDPSNVREVQSVISRLSGQGLTMLIVTHDLKFSREVSDRVFYMDEGIIYDDGTPEEIYEHPVKEKTINYVNYMQSYKYDIVSEDFDIYELYKGVDEYVSNHMLDPHISQKAVSVLEEVIMVLLRDKSEKISVSVSHSKVDNALKIELIYGGENYDPLEDEDADKISKKIVESYICGREHIFSDNINKLSLSIDYR